MPSESMKKLVTLAMLGASMKKETPMPSDQNQPSEWAREKAESVIEGLLAADILSFDNNDACYDAAISTIACVLEAAVAERDEAIRVLAHDKVHGIADMIGAKVLANPIARAAVDAAKGGK